MQWFMEYGFDWLLAVAVALLLGFACGVVAMQQVVEYRERRPRLDPTSVAAADWPTVKVGPGYSGPVEVPARWLEDPYHWPWPTVPRAAW